MRVLVVRPQADAERSARRLAARGHEAVVAPVLRIDGTGEAPPPGTFQAVLLTSANAVPALASIAGRVRDAPIFAVGERTASAAAEAGFEKVWAADGDAASLCALIAQSVPPQTRLLHIVGRDRKPEPGASLAEAGFAVSVWTAYAAVAADRLPSTAEGALREGRLDAAIHYSRRSAGVLLDLAGAAGVREPLLALAHACLSADAAAPLRDAGAGHVSIADRPDEDALLAALDRRTK